MKTIDITEAIKRGRKFDGNAKGAMDLTRYTLDLIERKIVTYGSGTSFQQDIEVLIECLAAFDATLRKEENRE